jgi:PAS domain-containing protein
MAIEVFNGSSIPRELATAAMEFLLAKWKTLNATKGLTLQRLTEECSYPLRQNCTHLISSGNDFIYTYVGQTIQARSRRDLTGTLISQSDNPLAPAFLNIYRQCVLKQAPAFVRYTGFQSQDGQLWQRLVLPVPVGNETMIIVYSELIDHKTEVYEHLFRTAPDAMIIACPIVNDAGHATDGWITMMNDRARELLNFKRRITNTRLNDLPQFAGVDIWGRLYAPRSAATVTPIHTDEFDVELMRFPNAFGLKIRPKLVEGVRLVPAADADYVASDR